MHKFREYMLGKCHHSGKLRMAAFLSLVHCCVSLLLGTDIVKVVCTLDSDFSAASYKDDTPAKIKSVFVELAKVRGLLQRDTGETICHKTETLDLFNVSMPPFMWLIFTVQFINAFWAAVEVEKPAFGGGSAKRGLGKMVCHAEVLVTILEWIQTYSVQPPSFITEIQIVSPTSMHTEDCRGWEKRDTIKNICTLMVEVPLLAAAGPSPSLLDLLASQTHSLPRDL